MTRQRRGRFSRVEGHCDAGCRALESLQHISQACPRSWGPLIYRHNKIRDLLGSFVEKRLKQNVKTETKIQCGTEGYQPDLLTKDFSNQIAYIIDITVCSDGTEDFMTRASRNKTAKYEKQEVLEAITKLMETEHARVIPTVISWRGNVQKGSAQLMHDKLKLTASDLETLSVRTLELTHRMLVQYEKSSGGHEDVMMDADRTHSNREARLHPEQQTRRIQTINGTTSSEVTSSTRMYEEVISPKLK